MVAQTSGTVCLDEIPATAGYFGALAFAEGVEHQYVEVSADATAFESRDETRFDALRQVVEGVEHVATMPVVGVHEAAFAQAVCQLMK